MAETQMEQELIALFQANKHFCEHCDQQALAEQSKGQHPKIVAVGCSDSRAPLEVVCGDSQTGRMFTVRGIGGAFDTLGAASIKYGILHLGIKDVVFFSHEMCGAVAAAQKMKRDGVQESDIGNDPLKRVAFDIARNISDKNADPSRINEAIIENADAQIRKIGEFVRNDSDLRDAPGIKVFGMHYSISTGRLQTLESFRKEASAFGQQREAAPEAKKSLRLRST